MVLKTKKNGFGLDENLCKHIRLDDIGELRNTYKRQIDMVAVSFGTHSHRVAKQIRLYLEIKGSILAMAYLCTNFVNKLLINNIYVKNLCIIKMISVLF